MNNIDKMYFYETISDQFDSVMNMYDTNKRIFVIFDQLLTEDIRGKKLLDAGCGTGWFSKKACDRGAKVVSMDLGEGLLNQVASKCKSDRVVGSILDMPFDDDTFDVVISSEVIEHTPDPVRGIEEMYRVLKPGGTLVLTTPNKLWYPLVWLANALNVRPYQGLENWVSWFELSREVDRIGFDVDKMVGIHLLPFVHPLLHPILDYFHQFNERLGPLMLNMAVKCYKPHPMIK